MLIALSQAFEILTVLGSLIGVWVTLNNKITKLEAQVETNKVNIDKINSDRKEITDDLKEIKTILQQMQIKLTELEVHNKLRQNEA